MPTAKAAAKAAAEKAKADKGAHHAAEGKAIEDARRAIHRFARRQLGRVGEINKFRLDGLCAGRSLRAQPN